MIALHSCVFQLEIIYLGHPACTVDDEIRYVHLPELGAPKQLRKEFEDETPEFFRRYREHVDEQDEALSAIKERIGDYRTALLCYERDVEDCHRKVLAELFANNGWDVTHL